MSKKEVSPKVLGIFLAIVLILALFLRLKQVLVGSVVIPDEPVVTQVETVKEDEPVKSETREVTSELYKVSVQIPITWIEDPNSLFNNEFTRYQDENGFISFDVAGTGEESIDEITSQLAGATSKPFGNEPAITSATIDGQSARFILPSVDQAKDKHDEAVLIVTYPTQVVIDLKSYNFLVLYADKDFLYEIGQRLRIKD